VEKLVEPEHQHRQERARRLVGKCASAAGRQGCPGILRPVGTASPAEHRESPVLRPSAGRIATDTGAEFSKAAESQIAEVNRKVISLVDEVTKNAPAGSETYVSAIKTAITNANAGYEQFSKTTKQAVEAIESNLNSAVSQYTQAASKAANTATAAA
jgi:hypothetical protein